MSAPERRCELNVTPLIDVLLVLLILFMVLVPARERTLASELAHPQDGATGRPAPRAVLSVTPEGTRLDGVALSESALERALRERAARDAALVVLVRAEGDVAYSRVVDAIDLAHGAGARSIGLVSAAPPP